MAGSLVLLSRTPDHPPYAEMISAAIRSLREECGSSESSISTYIKSNHQDLPVAHSNLLSYHLSKLIRLGEIAQPTPNSYSVPTHPNPQNHNPNPNPNPSHPPRRERPPPKNPKPSPSHQPRRGRPPKTETLNNGGSKRRRGGKPPKRKPDGDKMVDLLPGAAVMNGGDVPLRRRRGRPPKPKGGCVVGPGGVGSKGEEGLGLETGSMVVKMSRVGGIWVVN